MIRPRTRSSEERRLLRVTLAAPANRWAGRVSVATAVSSSRRLCTNFRFRALFLALPPKSGKPPKGRARLSSQENVDRRPKVRWQQRGGCHAYPPSRRADHAHEGGWSRRRG